MRSRSNACEDDAPAACDCRRTNGERAQLVLAAAAVLAVALAPIVFAYLQLGYHADVAASGEYTTPGRNAERVLSRGVHEAAAGTPSEYDWSERSAAIDEVRSRLAPNVDALRSSRVESGTAYRISYNETAAESWRSRNCPRGPNRRFGECTDDEGIVVQNRTGQTHVLAVAFDVRIVTERGTTELTLVTRAIS